MKKQLTLIIPTYNMERYLRTCLDSLIVDEGQQTLEVLIINDGSKDASSTIAHEYEEQMPDVFRVIDKENGNYGSCINRGLMEATGRYVKVLDADDHFDTTALKTFLQAISTIDTDMILTDNTIFGDNDISKKYYGFELPQGERLFFNDYAKLLSESIQMHNVTYKKELFNQFDYHQTEGISYTDQEWIFEPMSHVSTFTYLPLPLYKYLIGREGQTISPEQIRKSSTHALTLCNDMLTMYKKREDIDLGVHFYLYARLWRQVKSLYRTYLVEVPGLELEGLKAFDHRLEKELPRFYRDSENISMSPIIRIKYVSYWRRHQHAQQPKWFYTIFNGYTKTLVWCKRILNIHHV